MRHTRSTKILVLCGRALTAPFRLPHVLILQVPPLHCCVVELTRESEVNPARPVWSLNRLNLTANAPIDPRPDRQVSGQTASASLANLGVCRRICEGRLDILPPIIEELDELLAETDLGVRQPVLGQLPEELARVLLLRRRRRLRPL